MVGHVNRAAHVYVREDQAPTAAAEQTPPVVPPVLTNGAVAPVGEVHGMMEIRDKDGNLKAVVPFGGTTGLTHAQLEQELGMKIPLVTGGEEQNGGDPNHDGA